MLIPYSVDVPRERLPIANWAIIVLTCAVSFWVFAHPPGEIRLRDDIDPVNRTAAGQVDIEDSFEADFSNSWLVLARREWKLPQLFGHMLTHGDLVHLAGNMLFLFVFGNALNAKVGHVAYTAFYVIAGMMAGVGWLLFGSGPAVLGASGAISAVTGAFLILYPWNDVKILFVWWTRFGTFAMASFWVIILYIIFDILGIVFGSQGVAYEAHIAGAVVGLGVASAAVLTGLVRSESYEQNLFETFGWMRGG